MEWEVDETLTKMVATGQSKGVIVVGIDSGEFCQRMKEYTGWQWKNKNCGQIDGEGAFYSAFLVNQVKPYIDKHYRTKTGREHAYLGGSSLGGYMAIFTAVTYQNTFSKVIGLSSSVIDEYTGAQLREYILTVKRQQRLQFYLDIGTQEVVSQSDRSAYLIAGNRLMAKTLIKAGFAAEDVTFKLIEGGVHDEISWAKRLPKILALMGI
jgi:predicted alpha/beta superfamily hydrolase